MLWGTTGWPTPPPLVPVPLQIVYAVLMVAGVVGAFGCLLRSRAPLALGTLTVALLWIFLAVVLRNFPLDDSPVTSSRYLVPGLVALATVLVAGWHHFWRGTDRQFRTTMRLFAVTTHALFIGFVFVPFLGR